MGWPPAVVIVVRHGARLDAADKKWHLTSPTPYDPPLTYGGWNQSKALGVRIANILRTRETDDEVPLTSGEEGQNGGNHRKRRHRVIIHSSPFLRCVQTSVGISAGLAQNPGHSHRSSSSISKAPSRSSPKIRPEKLVDSPNLDPIPEPNNGKINGDSQKQPHGIKKSTIRVDAFLGEWLSPDYFESITPPPSSIMMVASAKADLLRREDYSHLQIHAKPTLAPRGFPGGWGSPVMLPQEREEKEDGLSSLSSLAQALPRRDRTSSLSSIVGNGSRFRTHSPNQVIRSTTAEHGTYQAPIPTYAISQSDPIPAGYVAHARDACADVDYQWDSMREPQMWGHGGEYGEEWSSMHKRFRNGLKQMIHWYLTTDDPGSFATKSSNSPRIPHSPMHDHFDFLEEDGAETDLVLILVTHGAGCNALIGALTNQPVLLDVGMASLTMAVRKPTPVNTPASSPGHSRANSRNMTISEQYEVKLIANTEHLRSSTPSTPSSSRTPSLTRKFREPSSTHATLDRPVRAFTASGNIGNLRRATNFASVGVGPQSKSYAPTRQTSMGLWSPTPANEEETEEPEDSMILNFGNDEEQIVYSPVQSESGKEGNALINGKEMDNKDDDDVAPLGGLWERLSGHTEHVRETGHKRRWTVNERTL